jgi:hypothetical protein
MKDQPQRVDKMALTSNFAAQEYMNGDMAATANLRACGTVR